MRQKHDLQINWITNNPILLNGEIGISTDITPINFKIGNGVSYWTELDYVISSNDNVLENDIVADGVEADIGIPDGTTVLAGTSFEEWLSSFYRKANHPIYYIPSFSILPNSTSVESGTYINPSIIPTFIQQDAGNLNNYLLTRSIDGVGPVTLLDQATLTTYNQPNIQVSDGSNRIQYIASASYDEGATKNNNLGDPDPIGKILAGTLIDTLYYTGYRKAFYGADTGSGIITNSVGIRALSGTYNNPQNGTVINITIPIGTTRITIAYPASLTDINSILYQELGNANVLDTFIQTTVNVDGANGYNAIAYKVYTYEPAIPFTTAATYIVTI